MNKLLIYSLSLFIPLTLFQQALLAEDNPDSYEEPKEVIISAPRTANQEPAGAITTIASTFRYDPQVDLQDRNLAETQSDITIRGGTFEMSGFTVGAAPVYDPQTGHYTAEIPIPTSFLSAPAVITGSDNALAGFNSTAGSIQTTFAPTDNWNMIKSGVGDFGTNIQEVAIERSKIHETDIGTIGFSSDFAHSSSNGSAVDGDSEFARYAARAQLYQGTDRQTDLFYGYQQKDFRWPYMYALQELHDMVGSSGVESESLDTAMVMLNHRNKISETGEIEFTSYYKRNHDDYEFDHFSKDMFNPYRHTTKVYGAGAQLSEEFGDNYVGANAQVYGDQIDSTSLTYGNYDSRTLAKISSYVGRKIALEEDLTLDPSIGAAWDKSDRTAEKLSPIAKVALEKETDHAKHDIYVEYSESSQLPGYTALNSNPNVGLFRGNKSLNRQVSNNSELGYQVQTDSIYLNAAMFYRQDDDMTDWTYSSNTEPFAARSANNVDVSTRGLEIYGARTSGDVTVASSYALLDKHADYALDGVDSSFYALNYPEHRITNSVIARPFKAVEVRGDLEFRKQYQNELRLSDDKTYLLSSLSANYAVAAIEGLSLAVIVDNVGNEHFEEVPGVPGSGRLASVVANYIW